MSQSLKDQIAAAKATNVAVETIPDADPQAEAEAEADPQAEAEAAGGHSPAFRKSTFAFTFKYGNGVIKADKFGIYTPKNEEEFEILKHQVLRGNILFN